MIAEDLINLQVRYTELCERAKTALQKKLLNKYELLQREVMLVGSGAYVHKLANMLQVVLTAAEMENTEYFSKYETMINKLLHKIRSSRKSTVYA